MSKTVACIIARTTSKRLPLKVLRHIYEDYSLLDFLISRIKLSKLVDEIYICTSFEEVDDIMEDVALKNNVNIYRGDPNNIIERMLSVSEIEKADILLRITGDNPFTSYEYIDDQIKSLIEHNLDYSRLVNVPIGATAEVMKTTALIECSKQMNQSYSEYLMLYMFEPNKRNCGIIRPLDKNYSHELITVDTKEDFDKVKSILKKSGKGIEIKLVDLLQFLKNGSKRNDDSVKIKLPENKEITLAEFNEDMERRIQNSVEIKLG
jgi:spore coat polysaccharide biosynthesis protein SpsF